MVHAAHIHSIHNIQRTGIVQGTDTTNHDTAALSRSATLGYDIDPGNFTLKGLPDIHITLRTQLLGTDICHGTGKVGFFLCTVSDYDHFIQSLGIFYQYNTKRILIGNCNFFCQITDIRNFQN